LVVVLALWKDRQLVEVFGESRSVLGDANKAVLDQRGLCVESHDLVGRSQPARGCRSAIATALGSSSPLLAEDAVRHVGEPLALVVAETLAEAMDAAERVDVVYGPLGAVARSQDALAPGAPPIWAEHGPNLCIDSEAGDPKATEDAFAPAAHVVRLQTTINRVTVYRWSCPRCSVLMTVYTSAGGGVIRQQDDIAGALDVAKDAVRVNLG